MEEIEKALGDIPNLSPEDFSAIEKYHKEMNGKV